MRVDGDGWEAALREYELQAADLHAGRTLSPHATGDGLTLKDLCNEFLTAKLRKRQAGEIGERTFAEYKETTDLLVSQFGGERVVSNLTPRDFGALAATMAEHPHTVRAALRGYRQQGNAAFYPDKPGPGPDHDRRAMVTAKLAEPLGQERTWTSQQLAEALGPDIRIGRRQTRGYLILLKAGYRRTAQTVAHKQDSKKVARAKTVLSNLKKS